MYLTTFQESVLGAMRDKPIEPEALKRAIAYTGHHSSFLHSILRMRTRGFIEIADLPYLAYILTEKGRKAFELNRI